MSRGEMREHAVEVVGDIRATRATLVPAGAQHEMVNQELAAVAKEIAQRGFAVWAFEHVVFLDALPREFAAQAVDFVPQARELLFFG